MNPGRLDEQPMPLTVSTWCGCRPSSASAFCSAASTPKSPQPGHQSGLMRPLKSLAVSGTRSVVVIAVVSLHHDFLVGNVDLHAPLAQLAHAVGDVMRHERLAVVLADAGVGGEAGLAAQVALELSGVVVLDDDGLVRPLQDRGDGVA